MIYFSQNSFVLFLGGFASFLGPRFLAVSGAPLLLVCARFGSCALVRKGRGGFDPR